jgi:hypothetical protein
LRIPETSQTLATAAVLADKLTVIVPLDKATGTAVVVYQTSSDAVPLFKLRNNRTHVLPAESTTEETRTPTP